MSKKQLIQKTDLHEKEINALVRLITVISEYEDANANQQLMKRARDAGADQLLEAAQRNNIVATKRLLDTLPKERLEQFRAILDNVQVKIDISKESSEYPTAYTAQKHYDFLCVPRETVNFVNNYILENECMLCQKTSEEAQTCEFRRHVAATHPYKVEIEDGDNCKFSMLHFMLNKQ